MFSAYLDTECGCIYLGTHNTNYEAYDEIEKYLNEHDGLMLGYNCSCCLVESTVENDDVSYSVDLLDFS